MRIMSMVREHFRGLIGKEMETPVKRKPFRIIGVTPEGEWQIVLEISTGNEAKVYLTDILRVYTYVVSTNELLTQADIDRFVQRECVTKGITPYVIPLLATFADIATSTRETSTIQYRP